MYSTLLLTLARESTGQSFPIMWSQAVGKAYLAPFGLYEEGEKTVMRMHDGVTLGQTGVPSARYVLLDVLASSYLFCMSLPFLWTVVSLLAVTDRFSSSTEQSSVFVSMPMFAMTID